MSHKHASESLLTEKPFFRYQTVAIWLLAILAGIYIGSSVIELHQYKRQLEDQVAQQLLNQALSVKRVWLLRLRQMQIEQQRIADQFMTSFPDDFAVTNHQEPQRLLRMLTQSAAEDEGIELLGIADQHGRVRYMSNNVVPIRGDDQIDVDAWRRQGSADMAVVVSHRGPSDWRAGLQLIYPIRRSDGSPRAFVFILLDGDAFERNLLEQLKDGFSIGKHVLFAALETESNRLVFRYPPLHSEIGKQMPSMSTVAFRGGKQFIYIVSPYDHIKRLASDVPLMGGIYTLRVAAAEVDYLAPWYAQCRSTGISAALLLGTLALLFYMLKQSARQATKLVYEREQLAISSRALSALIDAAPVAQAQVRQYDGKLLTANPAFKQLFGLMPGQGVSVAAALFASPATWEKLLAEWERLDHQESVSMECELNIGGTTRHALVSAARLPTAQNAQHELLLSFTDTELQYAREKELSGIAYFDALTQLANRRSFFTQADAAVAMATRYLHPLALLMIDLDHFKRVNDTYGHAAGDAVLVMTAQCLRQSLRETDLPARLGGEEFVVMLPETRLDHAMQTAERIRRAIEQAPAVEFDSHRIQVTASIGVAMLSEGKDIHEAMQQADKALYKAKETGRNKVVGTESL